MAELKVRSWKMCEDCGQEQSASQFVTHTLQIHASCVSCRRQRYKALPPYSVVDNEEWQCSRCNQWTTPDNFMGGGLMGVCKNCKAAIKAEKKAEKVASAGGVDLHFHHAGGCIMAKRNKPNPPKIKPRVSYPAIVQRPDLFADLAGRQK